jgi:hypothetical protein
MAELDDAVAAFRSAPGFVYQLYGIEQLMQNARASLDDHAQAQQTLANALEPDEVFRAIEAYQQRLERALDERQAGARRVLRWRGRIDGKDILHVRGDALEIEHLLADPVSGMEFAFENPLPAQEATVLIRVHAGRPIGPFVLEHPNAQNNFTAKIYMFDAPPSSDIWDFDLYYLPESPQSLGLQTPW